MDESSRFWSKVRWVDGHAIWTAAKLRGRGAFKCDGKAWDAPRLAWCEQNGPVPPGATIKVMCGEPSCVAPNHLRACSAEVEARTAQEVEYWLSNSPSEDELSGLSAKQRSRLRSVCDEETADYLDESDFEE